MIYVTHLSPFWWSVTGGVTGWMFLPEAEGKSPIRKTIPACSSGEFIDARCAPIATQFDSAASKALSLSRFHNIGLHAIDISYHITHMTFGRPVKPCSWLSRYRQAFFAISKCHPASQFTWGGTSGTSGGGLIGPERAIRLQIGRRLFSLSHLTFSQVP